jgi:hypothetical protein
MVIMSIGIDLKLIESYNDLFPSIKTQKTPLTQALQTGNGLAAQEIIDSKKNDNAEFTQLELWQIKVFKNLDFNDKEFLSLSPETQNIIYRTASNFNNIPLVTHLNSLKNFTLNNHVRSPSILSQTMDIATTHQVILDLLRSLRKDNRLLTKKELLSLKSDCAWKIKSDFTRVLGCKHLLNLIENLGLKHIKVPEKKAIIEPSSTSLSFVIDQYGDDLISIASDDVRIYAQEINEVKRFLSREEIIELFIIIEASNFNDIYPGNFIVSDDGIYFIDTEFKSFSGRIIWGKMGRLDSLVAGEDQEWFLQLINQKMQESENAKNEPPMLFSRARFCLKSLKKEAKRQMAEGNPEADLVSVVVDCKRIVKQCKLVGSDKARVFSFPLRDVL